MFTSGLRSVSEQMILNARSLLMAVGTGVHVARLSSVSSLPDSACIKWCPDGQDSPDWVIQKLWNMHQSTLGAVFRRAREVEQLIVCLQPSRRVEIEVAACRKTILCSTIH